MLTLKTGNCSKKGFTLLELVVVIFILSIIFAVSLPSFSNIGESRIKSDTKRLASILRYLNDSAISTKETYSLEINFKDKLIKYSGPDGNKEERFDSIFSVELQSKGIVSEGGLIIFFGPSGASEAINIFLRDDKKNITIAFNPLSGRVNIMTDKQQ